MRRSPGLQYTVDSRYIHVHVGQNVLPLYACRQVATIHVHVGCKVSSIQRCPYCPILEVPLHMYHQMSVWMSHDT